MATTADSDSSPEQVLREEDVLCLFRKKKWMQCSVEREEFVAAFKHHPIIRTDLPYLDSLHLESDGIRSRDEHFQHNQMLAESKIVVTYPLHKCMLLPVKYSGGLAKCGR